MLTKGDLIAGRYRLVRPIGCGGMASVWAARHELLEREVAIKVTPAAGKSAEATCRFLREASIVGRFSHRNIVTVLDAGEVGDAGLLFLVMELLRGGPLSDRFVPETPIPASEIVPILVDVCSGLEAAHAAGVVHRDVKPENIFLAVASEGIVPKLVDFGISQDHRGRSAITLDGQVLGTPAYMSPEQALGTHGVDARTDVWAVGVVLYEALTGKQPFGSSSHHAVLRRVVDEEPDPMPASVPADVRAIVERCLQKDPDRRYPDAAALGADLARVTDRAVESACHPTRVGEAPEAAPPASATSAARPSRPGAGRMPRLAFATIGKRRRAALLCAAGGALLCLGAAFPVARGATKHVASLAPRAEAHLAEHLLAAMAPEPVPAEPPSPGTIQPSQEPLGAGAGAPDVDAGQASAPAAAPQPVLGGPAASAHPRPITRVTSPGF